MSAEVHQIPLHPSISAGIWTLDGGKMTFWSFREASQWRGQSNTRTEFRRATEPGACRRTELQLLALWQECDLLAICASIWGDYRVRCHGGSTRLDHPHWSRNAN